MSLATGKGVKLLPDHDVVSDVMTNKPYDVMTHR